MKLILAAAVSALALSGAGLNLTERGGALTGGGRSPAMAVCIAGLEVALGGETPVRFSLSQSGRCGCPAACSAMTLRLTAAGVTLRL
jgi:hypothetical protein